MKVQVETVDLVVVLDFTTPKLVGLQLVLLSGTPGNSPDTGWGHAGGRGGQPGSPGTHSIMLAAVVVPVVLGELVEMEHTQMEERVDLVTYSHLTSKYQHQPCTCPIRRSRTEWWCILGSGWWCFWNVLSSARYPQTATEAAARGGGASHGPGAAGFAGAGNGVVSSTSGVHYDSHVDALANSGSGGGGGGGSGGSGGPGDGGSGGSGLVLISYPYPS